MNMLLSIISPQRLIIKRVNMKKHPIKATVSDPPSDHIRKGRSDLLIRLRDIKLVKRYYELSEIKRRRLDDILNILSTEEFFISEQRVWYVIRKNLHLVDALHKGESIDLTKDNQLNLFSE